MVRLWSVRRSEAEKRMSMCTCEKKERARAQTRTRDAEMQILGKYAKFVQEMCSRLAAGLVKGSD
jgi:hypothetical protein